MNAFEARLERVEDALKRRAVIPDKIRKQRDDRVRAGDLRHLLHADQLTVREHLLSCPAQIYVLEIARQWGKTWLLVTLAVEDCLRYPGCRVAYGSSTSKSLQEYIIPTIAAVTEDFPEDCRPVFDSYRNRWKFPNGSWISLFGCEDMLKARRSRGPKARRIILDEAGFIPILQRVVENVLLPQLTRLAPEDTPHSFILGSSPAEEPDHPFTALAEIAEANAALSNRSIYDNPQLTSAQIENLITKLAQAKGLSPEAYIKSDVWKREYLARRVIDKNLVAIPDWAEVRSTQFVALPRPQFFDATVGLDPGGVDPYYIAFTYWDFARAALVVEDEINFPNAPHSGQVIAAAKAKELELYGTNTWNGTLHAFQRTNRELWDATPDWLRDKWDEEAPRQPYVRWSDNNIDFCKSIYGMHGYAAVPTGKGTLEVMNNETRVMVAAKQVFVHPRCVVMDRHLRTATWANHRRQEYARRGGEHADGLATLNYIVRNIDRQRNPMPEGWGRQPGMRYREAAQPRTLAEKWAKAMKS